MAGTLPCSVYHGNMYAAMTCALTCALCCAPMHARMQVGNLTVGGRAPVVVHMLGEKPFRGPRPGQPGHQFLCSLDEVNRRALFPPTPPGG